MAFEAILAHRTAIDQALGKHKSPVTVMFTDLAGSTAYFTRHGDTLGLRWLEEHASVVIPCVEKNQGAVVKTIGDSVMAYFTDPSHALASASEIQRGIQAANESRDENQQMHIRVALHQGLGYLRGGDVFGDVVNVAARLAKACQPAQILVSEAVYLSVPSKSGLHFRSVGDVRMRGKEAASASYELLWTDENSYEKLRRQLSLSRPQRPPEPAPALEGAGGGRYVILNELGRGAMGVVYRAFDSSIGRVVALKTIPLEVEAAEREGLVERLKQEAHTAGLLDHPNIVTVFDVGEEAGLFYLTMQHLEGRTLAQVRQSGELLPLGQIYDIADQICAAMSYAHANKVIHRDLKPSNLMLTSGGTVKVMDFGIAKFGDTSLTRAGVVLGTPSYLSPEQAAGRRVDQRADIFALGAVFYELFTGERAFPGDSTTAIVYKIMNEDPIPPRAVEPSLSGPLDAVIRRALARDPEKRFQSCDELRQALRECRTGHGGSVRRSPAGRRLWPALGAAGLAAALLLGVGLWWSRSAQPSATPSEVIGQEVPRFHDAGELLRFSQQMQLAGRPAAAFPAFADYLERHPEDADVRLRYAALLGFVRHFDASMREYRTVLETAPESLEAQIGVAKVTSWQEAHPAALALYEDILSKHPDSYDALVGKGFTLLWMRRTAEAVPLFRQALERQPDDAEVARALRQAEEAGEPGE